MIPTFRPNLLFLEKTDNNLTLLVSKIALRFVMLNTKLVFGIGIKQTYHNALNHYFHRMNFLEGNLRLFNVVRKTFTEIQIQPLFDF